MVIGRVFAVNQFLYLSTHSNAFNRAVILSLIPLKYSKDVLDQEFEKIGKKGVKNLLKQILAGFKAIFYRFLDENGDGETIYEPRDADLLGRKLSNGQKLTFLEYFYLFVIFLKMHKSIDDG